MNNRITVDGLCCYIGPIEEVGGNGFRRRTIVLKEVKGNYTTYVAFTLKRDRVGIVSERDLNRHLAVTGYVESRDWTDPKTKQVRFFTDISAVKVELASETADKPEPTPAPSSPELDAQAMAEAEGDNLPF